MFFRKRYPYTVIVHLNGRHPYLVSHELDYRSRDVVLVVNAKSYNDAANLALNLASAFPFKWSCSVKSIMAGTERVSPRDEIIEEVALALSGWFPDNANTNAFCASIRSMKDNKT
jgi:hypothetical protein